MNLETRNDSARRIPRADVLGVGVHALHMRRALELLADAVEARRGGYVCLTGVHGVMEAQSDPSIRHLLDRAYLNLPDGMPTVWIGRSQGHASMGRVFGPDLMFEACRMSAERGYTQFLYGGEEGVAEALAERLCARFPGLRVVGTYTPPFRPLDAEEASDLEAQVAAVKPDLFWVGLSTPKQERFMGAFADRLDTGLMLGVGAAFDYHTGRLRDAPRWVKEGGLQWAHRLAQDPRRLWRRYASNNPRFVAALAARATGRRRDPPRPRPRGGESRAEPLCLNVGCGDQYLPGFVNIDGSAALERVDRVIDFARDPLPLHFAPGSVDYILASDVVEHLYHWQAAALLRDFHTLLRPGGSLEIRVPDAEWIMRRRRFDTDRKLTFLFGGQDLPQGNSAMDGARARNPEYFCHKYGWTRPRMTAELRTLGFSNVETRRAHTNFIAWATR